MKRTAYILFFSFFMASFAHAQSDQAEQATRNGILYFGFGTNRSFYSRSNISFQSSSFDFTLHKVRAEDDRGLKFGNGGAAQYSYQLGYYFIKKKFGIEFNFDHIKYFMRPNQVVHISGQINGESLNKDTLLSPGFIQFEHSDGANYALFNFVKWKNLAASQGKKNVLDLMLKTGAGPVIPKTNSTIMGNHYDDRYKLSGFVVALEGGLRYNFLKNFYIAPSIKGAYANYSGFAIANGEGKQHWFGLHLNLLVGGQLNL